MSVLHKAVFCRPMVGLLIIIGSIVLCSSVYADYSVLDVEVTFWETEITKEPAIIDGALQIYSDEKGIATIPALSIPISYVHQVRDRLSPHFSVAGPWLITLMTDQSPSVVVASIQADPRIESARIPGGELAGEESVAWFPDPAIDLFCLSQPQLHWSVTGEPLLGNDPCTQDPVSTDHDMDLPQAWGITLGDTNVVVAIVDTGFDLYHPGLGGPGPNSTVADSLLHYNEGVWFRNWNEKPGDDSSDGRPGLIDVNDDPWHDNYIDEDCWGNLPDNTPEPDVSVGSWTSLGLYTIEDASANWAPDELVGKMITLVRPPITAGAVPSADLTKVKITGSLGLEVAQQDCCFAFWVPVPDDMAISGMKWYNNDGDVVFPEVLVQSGTEDYPVALPDAFAVATNVQGQSLSWSEVSFSEPVASASGGLYVIFRIPENSTAIGQGTGGGPGVGYTVSGEGYPGWMSVDGLDWMQLHTDFGFAVRPLFVDASDGMVDKALSRAGDQGDQGEMSEPTANVLPAVTVLYPAAPNPFNPQTKLRYSLKEDSSVELAVFNLKGELVRRLVSERQIAGEHEIVWDGGSRTGQALASGVYFARLVAGRVVMTQRLVLLK